MSLTIQSASIPAGGNYLDVTFTSTLGNDAAPVSPGTGITGVTFTMDGETVDHTDSAQVPSNDIWTIRFYFTDAIYAGQIVTLTTSGTNITDASSEPLIDVTNFAVTNGSEVSPPPPDESGGWTDADVDAYILRETAISAAVESSTDRTGAIDRNAIKLNGSIGRAWVRNQYRAVGWTMPLVNPDTDTLNQHNDLEFHACRWQLAESKNYGLYVSKVDSFNVETADETGESDRVYLVRYFKMLADEQTVVTASGGPAPQTTTSASGRISVAVGPAKVYPGTQGIYVRTYPGGVFGGRCG